MAFIKGILKVLFRGTSSDFPVKSSWKIIVLEPNFERWMEIVGPQFSRAINFERSFVSRTWVPTLSMNDATFSMDGTTSSMLVTTDI